MCRHMHHAPHVCKAIKAAWFLILSCLESKAISHVFKMENEVEILAFYFLASDNLNHQPHYTT